MVSKTFTLLGLAAAAVARGVAISGGDFGCEIDGSCPTGKTQLPLSSLGGGDGEGQMNHFANDDKLNMFRLPVGWQFLVNNQLGGTLNAGNLGKYDQVMQKCLATGAYCMLDIHNFARWNGGIIGQGGPTDDQFVSLWTQLATKYKDNEKVVFELMNEPHDLDVKIWAATCQKVVTAIRGAGATKQMILLPGTNFNSAEFLVSSGSADALTAITNPDGTTDNLIIDVHKYLDEDNSGTHKPCTTDNVESFRTVAEYLRSKGRKGLVSETGASSDSSCFTAFCAQNTFINQNSDVFIGLVGWAAGSFGTDYVLSLTPKKSGNSYTDNDLMKQCVLATWNTELNVTTPVSAQPSKPAASAKPSAALSSVPASVPISAPDSAPTSAPSAAPVTSDDGSAILPPTTVMTVPTTLLIDTSTPTPPAPTGTRGRNGTTTTSTPSLPTAAGARVDAMGSLVGFGLAVAMLL
ncbi:Endoglucanase EG-II [Colletotrichum fructicola]|uniref:Endoglucanase EG-II n=1 Tax=Colletotrichum fructicola (strain Nara gc5) TaxID=1213859 RepID=L2G6B6_COLFN|nr:Endoglucanase EG-II [Colletotrichum fructicola]KAF4900242.1 Endoglucanase EG-II [Colletotrichum fructicola]KAF4932983.1 Endoglucanase EG-II [Colletotrichum fructicola]